MTRPHSTVTPNTWAFLRDAMIAPTGFREYDARWKYPEGINLPGITALGLGLGTQMHARGIDPVIAVGNDYRDYSLSIKNALMLGLMQAGIAVRDIGPCLSPMAYFAQFHLDAPAVAMVTASHNPNGWTGVKMGFERPLTHGPDEMAELKGIVLNGEGKARAGGTYEFVDGVREAYLDDLVGDFKMTRNSRWSVPPAMAPRRPLRPSCSNVWASRWSRATTGLIIPSRITTRTPKRWRCCTT